MTKLGRRKKRRPIRKERRQGNQIVHMHMTDKDYRLLQKLAAKNDRFIQDEGRRRLVFTLRSKLYREN